MRCVEILIGRSSFTKIPPKPSPPTPIPQYPHPSLYPKEPAARAPAAPGAHGSGPMISAYFGSFGFISTYLETDSCLFQII